MSPIRMFISYVSCRQSCTQFCTMQVAQPEGRHPPPPQPWFLPLMHCASLFSCICYSTATTTGLPQHRTSLSHSQWANVAANVGETSPALPCLKEINAPSSHIPILGGRQFRAKRNRASLTCHNTKADWTSLPFRSVAGMRFRMRGD